MGKQRRLSDRPQTDCTNWAAISRHQSRFPSAVRSYDLSRSRRIFSSILAKDVIPRLLEEHPGGLEPPAEPSDAERATLAQYVDEFSELVIHADASEALAFFQNFVRSGITTQVLFHSLLAPTARRLGELWDEDINDFMDVTRGVGHLQEIVRSLGESDPHIHRTSTARYEALFMTLPGEQHTLGLAMLREDFLRAGWHVWCGPAKSYGDIIETVSGRSFDLVGLSASSNFSPQDLKTAISLLRKASRNDDIKVVVGGSEFERDPALVAAVGAEATARSGTQALHIFQRLLLD